MEFYIDRKFWNLVIKKVKPSTAQKITSNLDPTYKLIKKDFALKLPSKKIIEKGFFREKCTNGATYDISTKQSIDIEKGIIKVLIDIYRLSPRIKYREKPSLPPEFVIEPPDPKSYNFALNKGFVYFIRNDDIYKIGITDNLLRRFNQLKPDEILNVVRCTNYEDLETKLHRQFKKFRIPQSEYFRLDKNQVEEVHIEMLRGAKF